MAAEGSGNEGRVAVLTAPAEQLPGYRTVANVLLVAGEDDGPQDVLLVMRLRDEHEGMFTPPGGTLNPGESPKHAARREIREELGYDIPDDELKLAGIGTLHTIHRISYLYIHRLPRGAVDLLTNNEPDEHELRWFRPSSVLNDNPDNPAWPMAPGLREVLRTFFVHDQLAPWIGTLLLRESVGQPSNN